MFLGLRMRDGFYREEFTQAFGIPIEAVYGDALNHLQQEELLAGYPERWGNLVRDICLSE